MTSFADIFAAHAPALEQRLGTTVTYTHYDATGAVVATFPKSITLVHFRESNRDRREYDDGQGDTVEAEVGVTVDDLGGTPQPNKDSFTLDGETWVCRIVRGTEGGCAYCNFGRYVNRERSAKDYRRVR